MAVRRRLIRWRLATGLSGLVLAACGSGGASTTAGRAGSLPTSAFRDATSAPDEPTPAVTNPPPDSGCVLQVPSGVHYVISGLGAVAECHREVDSGSATYSEVTGGDQVICQVDRAGETLMVVDAAATDADRSACGTLQYAPTPAAGPECAVGVQGHDATVVIQGPDAQTYCDSATQDGYVARDPSAVPTFSSIACHYDLGQSRATVHDTGGQYYAGIICGQLRQASWPSAAPS